MKLEDVKGKPVVSLADGARIGDVRDLVIDAKALALRGFLLGGDPGEGLLPLSAVRSNGTDAITVESASAVEWNTGRAQDSGQDLEEFLHLTVVDASGQVLGHIHDVNFSQEGKIKQMVIKSGGVLGLGAHETAIAPGQVRAVGEKMITVDLAG